MYKKFMLYLSIVVVGAFLGACQGTNSDPITTTTTSGSSATTAVDANSSISLVLPFTTKELDVAGESIAIDIRAYDANNNPYSEGNIKIVYPDDVRSGRDIGYFATSSAPLENGVAHFSYTAPADLLANTSDIVFKFYHENDFANLYPIVFTINPEAKQIVLNNYVIESSLEDENVTMALETSKLMTFAVTDDKGDLLSDTDMISLSITTLNPAIATLSDTTESAVATVTKENKNSVTVSLNSGRTSGLVPVEVKTRFKNSSGEELSLTKVFNIVILSGPPTAISLSYVGTTQKAESAKFVDSYAVTVTDKYNNLVNSNPGVSMGMLAGYAKSSAATTNGLGYLFYRTTEGNGTLDPLQDTFSSTKVAAFGNVDDANDYLVTFANGYSYNASGKWDFYKTADDAVLNLVDDYQGEKVSDLGFAVGNNKRQDMCQDGAEWLANVYPKDGSYIMPSTGTMVIDVEYDYYLVAKDTVLWVNLIGSQNSDGTITRIGEAKKVTLRGMGLESDIYAIAGGFKGTIRCFIKLQNTAEYLKNAHFDYKVSFPSSYIPDEWRIDDESQLHALNYCYGVDEQNGNAYVDVYVDTNYSTNLQLTNLVIGNEF